MSRLFHTPADFLRITENKGGLSLVLSAVLLLSKIPPYQFIIANLTPTTGNELLFYENEGENEYEK